MNIPEMRKQNLLVKDMDEIKHFLDGATTMRLAFNGEDNYPIILPLSYGYSVDGDKLTFYFHGGFNGVRYESLLKDNHVCIETDSFERYRQAPPSATADYISLVGFGDAVELKDDEKTDGMRKILEHCGYGYIDIDPDLFKITSVFKVELEEYTCKKKE